MFETVKSFYKKGLYTEAQVMDFVKKGKLTQEQYEEIINGNKEE